MLTDDEYRELMGKPEHIIFLGIKTVMEQLTQLQMDLHMESGKVLSEAIVSLRWELAILMATTERFGIDDFGDVEYDGTIKPSLKYLEWFNFWQAWYETMDATEGWKDFYARSKAGQSVASYLPIRKWNDGTYS